MFLLTGCTHPLKTSKNKAVTNPETGQSLTANILCKPTDENLKSIYEQYEDKLEFKSLSQLILQ